MIRYRPTTPRDVERLAVLLSPMDVLECRAAGHTPYEALATAQRSSMFCWTAEVDDWPHAMFGVVPGNYTTGLGYPWFLGSSKARRRARLFLNDAPLFLQRIELFFPRLEGYVHGDNTAAIRWLRRLGFVVESNLIHLCEQPMLRFTKGF